MTHPLSSAISPVVPDAASVEILAVPSVDLPVSPTSRLSVPPLGFASRAVHAGERVAFPTSLPASTPIYASSSFCYDDPAELDAVLGGERRGHAYSRYGNPTIAALEAAIAALEGTEAAVCVASGMAALHLALLAELRAGDAVVAAIDLYGSTTALLQTVFGSLGVRTRLADIGDLPALAATVAEVRPRVVLIETISNPLVRVADIASIAEIAHAAGATLIVDNTFATPYLITPVHHGADMIVHSTTKYLGGHGDVTGGAIATTAERAETLVHLHRLAGAVPSPFDAWLTLRGIKTLPLRLHRQSESAAIITARLAAHPKIAAVHYPGMALNAQGDDRGRAVDRADLENNLVSETPPVVGEGPVPSRGSMSNPFMETSPASERPRDLSLGVQPRATSQGDDVGHDHDRATHPAAPPRVSPLTFHDALFRTSCRGGMAAFEIAGAGRSEAARKGVLRFLAALRMVRPATTLGDVYSLVLYPAMSTHRDLSPEERAAAGIGDGLLRLSVGIEDVADILTDLEHALDTV